MESIDDAINYEEEYKTYLQGVKKNGNSLIAKCPFHDDSKPSFSVDLMTGKYHCFGCEEKGNFISFVAKVKGIDTQLVYQELCSKYNFVPPKVNFEENLENEPFCLKTYAKMKMIPLPYLEKIWKLSDSKKGIKIPYFDINENVVATRYRGENKAFRWEKNSKIVPYGLQRSLRFVDDDYVILVEGESDTQSLSLAGFSVLGIPGATMFKVEWVKYLGNKIYTSTLKMIPEVLYFETKYVKLYITEIIREKSMRCHVAQKDPKILVICLNRVSENTQIQ